MNEVPKPRPRRRWVSRVIWAALLLTILGCWGYYYYWLAKPEGEGPAGPVVPREAFEKPWSDRKVALIGFGDSITAGWGASKGKNYFQRLAANPPDEFEDMKGINLPTVFPNFEAKNFALSGSDSLQHVELLGKIPQYNEDVLGIVVMSCGGNDIIHSYGRKPPREGAMYGATFAQARPWIANYETRLNYLIEQITSRFGGECHIFLANIYDPTDGKGNVSGAIPPFMENPLPVWNESIPILNAYNEIIARTAEKYDFVHLVDIHSEFLGHGIHCRKFWKSFYKSDDPTFWYQLILEDPNDRGYDALRRLFLLEMIRVFAPAQGKAK